MESKPWVFTIINQPFKGLTHVQFRFTKLNIVDKFGKVVSGVVLKPAKRIPDRLPDTIHPCLNDQGPNDTITSPKWLPFDPPAQASTLVSPQLEKLRGEMTGQNGAVYLRAFCDMITKAVELMPFAPAGHAVYATAIVGKPLALVNAGFSLELSTPPLEPQTTLPPKLDPNPPTEADVLFAYKFPIKIRDRDHPYHGAFFHLGLTPLTRDVPTEYDEGSPLSAETWVADQQARASKTTTAPIRLPIGGAKKGFWNWLQLYQAAQEGEGEGKERNHKALEVGEDGKLKSFLLIYFDYGLKYFADLRVFWCRWKHQA
ncbi:hypothetical protein OEA41_000559 [Lepraria neglecta]|uniref:Uncharacterized protein n=1 Tax=Lepraria neglecta TaxID=209136 RepID=A0AAD9ZFV6_9LECA|nr:hypothetical protein OEA41_000559 [Lepraria neglecta]